MKSMTTPGLPELSQLLDPTALHARLATLADPRGTELARGLANYAASEARLIARKPSSQIEGLLGYANEPELIHRDNLVLTA